MGDTKKAKMADGTVIEIETEESLPEGATLMEDAVATEDAPAWAAALMAGLMDLKARVDGMAPAAAPMGGGYRMEDASLAAPIAAVAPVVPSAPVQMGDMARRLAQLEPCDVQGSSGARAPSLGWLGTLCSVWRGHERRAAPVLGRGRGPASPASHGGWQV